MSDIEARLSPGIKSLDIIDRMEVFRAVVLAADLGAKDTGVQTIQVGAQSVCFRVVGKVIAIGFAAEFSTPRKSDDA